MTDIVGVLCKFLFAVPFGYFNVTSSSVPGYLWKIFYGIFIFYFLSHCVTCGIFVPPPGVESELACPRQQSGDWPSAQRWALSTVRTCRVNKGRTKRLKIKSKRCLRVCLLLVQLGGGRGRRPAKRVLGEKVIPGSMGSGGASARTCPWSHIWGEARSCTGTGRGPPQAALASWVSFLPPSLCWFWALVLRVTQKKKKCWF